MGEFFTPAEIAARFRIDDDTVRNWIRRGQLKATKVGKQYRVTEEDLQEFLQKENKPGEGKKAEALAA